MFVLLKVEFMIKTECWVYCCFRITSSLQCELLCMLVDHTTNGYSDDSYFVEKPDALFRIHIAKQTEPLCSEVSITVYSFSRKKMKHIKVKKNLWKSCFQNHFGAVVDPKKPGGKNEIRNIGNNLAIISSQNEDSSNCSLRYKMLFLKLKY